MEQSILVREQCPICEHQGSHPVLKCKDFTVSGEEFGIVSCDNCGFKYTNPVPRPESIGGYYKSEDYISHTATTKGIVARLYHAVRSMTLRRKLRLISGFAGKGALLDYGCGTGNFLGVCKSAGWRVYGVEPDEGARSRVEEGIDVFSAWEVLDKEIAPDERFDVITMWHVLEHVYDLGGTLAFCSARLQPQGSLVLALPNHRSSDAAKYGAFWAAYDVPRHLYHFDKQSVGRLAEKAGFRVVKTLPMKFDSYYVSMLSEKYRGAGFLGLLRAVLTGLFSNLSAARTGEYSSLIYVLRKS